MVVPHLRYEPLVIIIHRALTVLKNILPRLKAHILTQTWSIPFTGQEPTFTPKELNEIVLKNNYIYLPASIT